MNKIKNAVNWCCSPFFILIHTRKLFSERSNWFLSQQIDFENKNCVFSVFAKFAKLNWLHLIGMLEGIYLLGNSTIDSALEQVALTWLPPSTWNMRQAAAAVDFGRKLPSVFRGWPMKNGQGTQHEKIREEAQR